MLKTGLYIFTLISFFALASQSVRSQNNQTVFELEGSVSNPVQIPADVVAVLKSDASVDKCFKTKGTGTEEAAWFEAAEFDLNADRRADLIVKSKNPCLFGANQGPFWVFRNARDGYQKVLSASGLKLTILPRKSNSFNTIQISKVVGMKGQDTQFRYSQGKYRPGK